MQILALEPYFDGSHRAFIDGWQAHSRSNWTLLTLPGYKWKWRMRHAPITLAQQLQSPPLPEPRPEVLLCSDMLNLAEFLGLAPAWLKTCRTILYFHENQLTYPVRDERERDYHFAMTNLTSALAAHAVWFNSEFHRQEFLSALEQFLKRMPDYQPLETIATIRAKSDILYPGIPRLHQPMRPANGPLHILWAARWEHDKNPEDFFSALSVLATTDFDFQLSVIGQSFKDCPPAFAQARKRFQSQIIHWGYQQSRAEYEAALGEADVVVSTAQHEFFGIGMLEAISAGAYPLLPKRLAYPEILSLDTCGESKRYFYDGTVADLKSRLQHVATLKKSGTLTRAAAPAIERAQRFWWDQQAVRLDAAAERVASL